MAKVLLFKTNKSNKNKPGKQHNNRVHNQETKMNINCEQITVANIEIKSDTDNSAKEQADPFKDLKEFLEEQNKENEKNKIKWELAADVFDRLFLILSIVFDVAIFVGIILSNVNFYNAN